MFQKSSSKIKYLIFSLIFVFTLSAMLYSQDKKEPAKEKTKKCQTVSKNVKVIVCDSTGEMDELDIEKLCPTMSGKKHLNIQMHNKGKCNTENMHKKMKSCSCCCNSCSSLKDDSECDFMILKNLDGDSTLGLKHGIKKTIKVEDKDGKMTIIETTTEGGKTTVKEYKDKEAEEFMKNNEVNILKSKDNKGKKIIIKKMNCEDIEEEIEKDKK